MSISAATWESIKPFPGGNRGAVLQEPAANLRHHQVSNREPDFRMNRVNGPPTRHVSGDFHAGCSHHGAPLLQAPLIPFVQIQAFHQEHRVPTAMPRANGWEYPTVVDKDARLIGAGPAGTRRTTRPVAVLAAVRSGDRYQQAVEE
jgi:hypothetical protein